MHKRAVYKERMEALKNESDGKYSNKRYVQQRLQPDGSVKIDVNMPEDLDFFDPMAPKEYGKLNPEIFRYIDDEAYFVPAEYSLSVNFCGRQLDDKQQKQVEASIKDHYNMQVYDKLDDIRNNRRLGIFLLVFGIIALAIYFFVTMFSENKIFDEIISIVGTFSIWEAVDCWLVNGHHTKVELNNALQMALMKVTFENAQPTAECPIS